MPLLERNKLNSTKSVPIAPINQPKEFSIPIKFLEEKNRVQAVVSWYYHCLREVKKTSHIPYLAQMKPAKMLLERYEFIDVLLAIRRSVGSKYTPSLWFLVKHPGSGLVGLE